MLPLDHRGSAATTLVAWLLVLAVVVLPGASFEKRYHCRVTGVRDLTACCCTAGNECGATAAASDDEGCCSSREATPPGECGCCDVTVERVGGDLAAVSELPGLERAQHPMVALRVVCEPGRALERDRRRGFARTPRKWTGPPVYLLHRSLLI